MKSIQLKINGNIVRVNEGTSIAAAILTVGISEFKKSINGDPRGPLCGMGVCQECCVKIGTGSKVRSCSTYCKEGMEVHT